MASEQSHHYGQGPMDGGSQGGQTQGYGPGGAHAPSPGYGGHGPQGYGPHYGNCHQGGHCQGGYGQPYGGGHHPGMHHVPHAPHHGYGPQPGYGMPNHPHSSGWFDFRDERFVKGLLVGAAATFLLTNEGVQKGAVRSLVKVWSMLQGGVEEMKERFRDAEAELQAGEAHKD